MDNLAKQKIKSSLYFWRFAKLFLFALILPIITVSLLVTFVPRKHDSFNIATKTESIEQNESLNYDKVKSTNTYDITLSEVKASLDSGKYSELSILRPENLGENSLKETALYPNIKKEILIELQDLMTFDDWTSWENTIKNSNYPKSKARSFVDNISSINFQLGRYLETSAFLFSAMYNNTAGGKLFSAEEALYNLLMQANDLFSSRTPAALSPRVYVDTLITEDPIFNDSIEKLKVKLIISYCKKRPFELDTQFQLLNSINQNYFNNEVIDLYSQVINRVTSKVSSKFREEIRDHYLSPLKAKNLSNIDPKLESSVFELYSQNIKHYLISDEISKAKSNYLLLTSIVGDSNKLSELQNLIDKQTDESKNRRASLDSLDHLAQNLSKKDSLSSKLFPTAASEIVVSGQKFEWLSLVLAIVVFLGIIIKRTRSIVLNIIAWIGVRVLKYFKYILGKRTIVDSITDELDASIKAGKTVPMASIQRGKKTEKKAVNA